MHLRLRSHLCTITCPASMENLGRSWPDRSDRNCYYYFFDSKITIGTWNYNLITYFFLYFFYGLVYYYSKGSVSAILVINTEVIVVPPLFHKSHTVPKNMHNWKRIATSSIESCCRNVRCVLEQ